MDADYFPPRELIPRNLKAPLNSHLTSIRNRSYAYCECSNVEEDRPADCKIGQYEVSERRLRRRSVYVRLRAGSLPEGIVEWRSASRVGRRSGMAVRQPSTMRNPSAGNHAPSACGTKGTPKTLKPGMCDLLLIAMIRIPIGHALLAARINKSLRTMCR
jgi:hypothetical protein